MNSVPPNEESGKSSENDQQQPLAMLQKSDLEMVRVLDDLIYLLIRKA